MEYTQPKLRINNLADYKQRITEIIKGQLRELIRPSRFTNIRFWIFSIFYIPFSLLYILFSLLEIIVDTIFLPIFMIPGIRIVPTIFMITIWSFTIAIGCFSFVNLKYDLSEPLF